MFLQHAQTWFINIAEDTQMTKSVVSKTENHEKVTFLDKNYKLLVKVRQNKSYPFSC